MATINITLEDRIIESAKSCEYQFWEQVAADFPEIKSGDFPHLEAAKLETAFRNAIDLWYKTNKTT